MFYCEHQESNPISTKGNEKKKSFCFSWGSNSAPIVFSLSARQICEQNAVGVGLIVLRCSLDNVIPLLSPIISLKHIYSRFWIPFHLHFVILKVVLPEEKEKDLYFNAVELFYITGVKKYNSNTVSGTKYCCF